MDEKRKYDLVIQSLMSEVGSANASVEDSKIKLDKANMKVDALEYEIGYFCKDNAFRSNLDQKDLDLYKTIKLRLKTAKQDARLAKTELETDKTRLYLAKKELQEFVDINKS